MQFPTRLGSEECFPYLFQIQLRCGRFFSFPNFT